MKKIVIAGGTGFLGTCLANYYSLTSSEVIIFTRGPSGRRGHITYVNWDGKTSGRWEGALNGAEVLINLNGKSVDCRYTTRNKSLIYSTRLDSTNALGGAITKSKNPPKLWINASSATIYRHSVDKSMDERKGEPGSGFSVDVCQKWEQAFQSFDIPDTRKVIIRTAIVLGKSGGAYKTLTALAKAGLGGRQGPGNQYVSWLHEDDFVSMIDFIINHPTLSGVVNLAAPEPVPNHQFMRALVRSLQLRIAVPTPTWLLYIGATVIGTETELVLKSRRVVPKRMLESGYVFKFTNIENALHDLSSVPRKT